MLNLNKEEKEEKNPSYIYDGEDLGHPFSIVQSTTVLCPFTGISGLATSEVI